MSNRDGPLVAIGLPVYNGERFLRESIDSIRVQTYRNWTLTIVDNASNDGTESICREYAQSDDRIAYFRNPTNVGLARNFNRAFSLSKGTYFRWHAHDDVLDEKFLELSVAALSENPLAALAYPETIVINEIGEPILGYDIGADIDLCRGASADRFKRYAALQRPSVARYMFGLTRPELLKYSRLMMSHMWADATLLSELLLSGPFILANGATIRLRVSDEHASALMGKKQLRAWQRVLDPRSAGLVSTWVSRYRRYWEYFVSVGRSADLSHREKFVLLAFCASLPPRRVPDVLGRTFRQLTHSTR